MLQNENDQKINSLDRTSKNRNNLTKQVNGETQLTQNDIILRKNAVTMYRK